MSHVRTRLAPRLGRQDSIDYADLVRRIRASRSLTQEQLAHELGVTFGTINGWECGRHQPLPALARMLEVLGRDTGLAPSMTSSGRVRKRA
jgi:putative transcriptional regulator